MSSPLNYPFEIQRIFRKKNSLKKELSENQSLHKIRVAILGGSTTDQVVNILELFLLKNGFRPSFYQSEYNQFYEDAVFGSSELDDFGPDIVYIHTSFRNVIKFPSFGCGSDEVENQLEEDLERFRQIWKALERFRCPVIQNNFDLPPHRSLGNLDCYDIHGKAFFLSRLNLEFAKAARETSGLFLNDINYLAASFGLREWHDAGLWHTAKYAMSFDAFPNLANSIAAIIASILGKSKKCLVLDLDNTCWGGVIGDDGMGGIQLGQESAAGESFISFQAYAKELSKRGVILAVASKNDDKIAREGFTHPDSVLKVDDFVAFKANWDPKPENIEIIAKDINIGLDSLVFIDDNAMERSIVKAQLPDVAVPDVGDQVINFIDFIEGNSYFEAVNISPDDIERTKFYSNDQSRKKQKASFSSYQDFLNSLEMTSEIRPFSNHYLERISQLINKTNQFNLTTKRYSLTEVSEFLSSEDYITLYGRLTDKFGDNGLITVVIGKIKDNQCHIDSWLMSCRVLKRDMEFAVLEILVAECVARGLEEIIGTYRESPKNKMVADLFTKFGFETISSESGCPRWRLKLSTYKKREIPININ